MVMLSSASRIVFTGLPPSARLRRGHAQRGEQSVRVEQGDRLAVDAEDALHEIATHDAPHPLLLLLLAPLYDEIHARAEKTEGDLTPVAHDEPVRIRRPAEGARAVPAGPERLEPAQVVHRQRHSSSQRHSAHERMRSGHAHDPGAIRHLAHESEGQGRAGPVEVEPDQAIVRTDAHRRASSSRSRREPAPSGKTPRNARCGCAKMNAGSGAMSPGDTSRIDSAPSTATTPRRRAPCSRRYTGAGPRRSPAAACRSKSGRRSPPNTASHSSRWKPVSSAGSTIFVTASAGTA